MSEQADILVIGGGIAGASAAYEVADGANVVVLEAESHPGYHSTGRSAAQFIQNYGNPPMRALARASAAFLHHPPDGFAEHPLLSPRGVLHLCLHGQEAVYEKELASLIGDFRRLTPEEIAAKVPVLRAEALLGGALESEAYDLDVAALHQGYLRGLKARGGRVVTNARVTALRRANGLWQVETAAGPFAAPILVNAAGAWADSVADLAGVAPLGIVPKRRTAAIVALPDGIDPHDWPLVVDSQETFYFKPEAGKIMVSPADETPVPASDVQPEDLDVAIGIDRFEQVATFQVRHVEHRWAGLRSFAADKTVVVGFEPRADGFFWLAGQGGYGIQTAPAVARTVAALIRGEALPTALTDHGVSTEALSPRRLIG